MTVAFRSITSITALIIYLMTTSMSATAQDPWAEYMTPSDMHTLFARYTGSFDMEISMPVGEGKEPFVTNVQSEHEMILGGRYLRMDQKGDMMGMDYHAIMTLGFNNSDRQMALTAITNMGTGTLSLFGPWDEKAQTATVTGQLTNPVTKKRITVRQTISFIDENTILIESFDTEGDRPEKKTVQYKLTRSTGR